MNNTNKGSWYNYKIGEYEAIEAPSDFADYIPQYGAAQNMYRLHMKLGDEPIIAALKVHMACVGDKAA